MKAIVNIIYIQKNNQTLNKIQSEAESSTIAWPDQTREEGGKADGTFHD